MGNLFKKIKKAAKHKLNAVKKMKDPKKVKAQVKKLVSDPKAAHSESWDTFRNGNKQMQQFSLGAKVHNEIAGSKVGKALNIRNTEEKWTKEGIEHTAGAIVSFLSGGPVGLAAFKAGDIINATQQRKAEERAEEQAELEASLAAEQNITASLSGNTVSSVTTQKSKLPLIAIGVIVGVATLIVLKRRK